MEPRKRILVLATGGKGEDEGGSGYLELEEQSRTSPYILDADIVAVVSNIDGGGVYNKSRKFGTPFEYFPKPYTAEKYRYFVEKYAADFVMCSGWINLVRGLNPKTTGNIHPAFLPEFGGPGMYSHYVHDAVMAAFEQGKIKQSAVSMHFVTDQYDRGPIFFRLPVLIEPNDTAETLARRVNEKERSWQSYILNLVVHHRIWLEGDGPDDWEVFHTCPELVRFIPGRLVPPGCEIRNTPKFC